MFVRRFHWEDASFITVKIAKWISYLWRSKNRHARFLSAAYLARLFYGEAVGLGTIWLAFCFSLSRAAFAVACCRRSESDLNCAAFGVD